MNHPPDWSFTSAYIDDALLEEERALFEEHLAGCAGCRREVDDLRALKSRLGAAPRRPLPAPLRAVFARRGQRGLWNRWRLPLPTRRWAAVGFATAALAGAALWVSRDNASGPAAIDVLPLMAAHAETAAERPIPVSAFYDETAVQWASADESDGSR